MFQVPDHLKTVKITREQLEQWCGTMISGEYLHGRAWLRSGDRFRVLGVLGDQLGEIEAKGSPCPVTHTPGYEWNGCMVNAPQEVMQALTESGLTPFVEVHGRAASITHHESCGVPMQRIAESMWGQLICEGES